MNDLNPHADWFADVRAVLDVAEAHPELPKPHVRTDAVEFFLIRTIGPPGPAAPRTLARAETILAAELGVKFTSTAGGAFDENYYILEAELPHGTPLLLKAWAMSVAEKRAIQVVTDAVEWVRLPVPPDEPAAPESSDEDQDAQAAVA